MKKPSKTTATKPINEMDEKPRKTTAINITGEPINEVDGLFAIARGLDHIAFEIRALGDSALLDAVREIKATISEKATEVLRGAGVVRIEEPTSVALKWPNKNPLTNATKLNRRKRRR